MTVMLTQRETNEFHFQKELNLIYIGNAHFAFNEIG